MPVITFEDDTLSVDVCPGTRLTDVCDEHPASLMFGCRNGLCGTCLLSVEAGGESLPPISPEEQEMLDVLAPGDAQARLGCQCVITDDVAIRCL